MQIARATLLLADDHDAFLAAVVRYLEPHFEVVKTVSDGQTLLDESARLKPDVVLLDISMPILSGIEAARRLNATGSSTRIVFLTVHADRDYVQAAFGTGALGYVVKSRLVSDLIPCLSKVLIGHAFISPSITV